MNPVMYLISNPRVPMSRGKRDAQVAHAAVEAYKLPAHGSQWVKHCWDERGRHYAKVSLQTDDLLLAQKYIEDRGFETALILDEGRTEFDADLTPTFLGVQIVDKDNAHVAATFGTFKLYKEVPLEGGSRQKRIQDIPERPLSYEGKRSFMDRVRERMHGNTTQRDS